MIPHVPINPFIFVLYATRTPPITLSLPATLPPRSTVFSRYPYCSIYLTLLVFLLLSPFRAMKAAAPYSSPTLREVGVSAQHLRLVPLPPSLPLVSGSRRPLTHTTTTTTTTTTRATIPDRTVYLLDYGAGNVRSVRNAITKLGYNIKVTFPPPL